ncbi:MAG TPA: hypothetical protein VK781_10765 [Solirubrobacteraceae bacterium]|jgi:hypothetical protein|nr:hypothetical protein [Solirubrobacteraceae bacterium]
MHHTNQTDGWDRGSSTGNSSTTPFDGGYLTDGEGLFHIERTLLNDPRGELLVELEDCTTLELIVCSARSVAELGLRPVQPYSQTAS